MKIEIERFSSGTSAPPAQFSPLQKDSRKHDVARIAQRRTLGWVDYGIPMGYIRGMKTLNAKQRFWKKVNKEAGCWIWTGFTNHKGYGIAKDEQSRTIRAHRLAFRLAGNQIPDGMMVLHKCDNPPCCNPSHLFIGTAKDNAQDAIGKGRHVMLHLKGEMHPASKLTSEKVTEMRQLHRTGIGFYRLGKRFGVSKKSAKSVVLRKTWKHVL